MPPVRARRRPTVGASRPAVQIRPTVKIRSAPALDPPFDDEMPPHAVGQPAGQLALDLHGGSPAPGRPAAGRAGKARQPDRTGDAGWPPGAHAGRPAGTSTESWQAARRFTAIWLEILNGYRPARHVRTLSSPAQAAGVVEQLRIAQDRAAALRRGRVRADTRDRLDPSRSEPPAIRPQRPGPRASPPQRPGPARGQGHQHEAVRLRGLHLCEPRRGIAEAVAVLHVGGRSWALAIRLERHQGRWLCTAARTV